jgi:hypothetical protein
MESIGLIPAKGSLEDGALGEVETKFAPNTDFVPNPLLDAGFMSDQVRVNLN